jgi:hypothetical protein
MKRLIFLVPIVSAWLIGVSIGHAQSAPATTYEINWYSIDGGGAMNVIGGSYSLGGTIGQADAGTLQGGSYTINGGFWNGGVVNIEYKVYLPLVLKNS